MLALDRRLEHQHTDGEALARYAVGRLRTGSRSLQRDAGADPEGDRRAGGDERAVAQRELAAEGGKRPGDEGAGVRESVDTELRAG